VVVVVQDADAGDRRKRLREAKQALDAEREADGGSTSRSCGLRGDGGCRGEDHFGDDVGLRDHDHV
jgi:hypothetical protein